MRSSVLSLTIALSFCGAAWSSMAAAQTPPTAAPAQPAREVPPPSEAEASGAIAPFGANLFTGTYAAQREDGINPDYTITRSPGRMV